MDRFPISKELAETIRELRLKKKIASKDIAKKIERSASYVSKFENGLIKSMPMREFDIMLQILLPECGTAQERVDMIMELHIGKYGYEVREANVQLSNFDMVYRLMPIPPSLIAEINEMLTKHNISVESLVSRINSNEDLTEDERQNEELPINEWFQRTVSGKGLGIKVNFSLEEVSDILEGNIESCNFVIMQAIVYYMYKFIFSLKNEAPSEQEYAQVRKAFLGLLDKHKFYTLSRRDMLLSQSKSKNQANKILNEFDIENQKVIKELLNYLKFASEMDIVYTNEALKQLIHNLSWDCLFVIKLMGYNFSEIGECSYNNKRQMLREIKAVVDKYIDMPEDKKMIEIYDTI